MTPQQIWQSVLSELELTLSRANFVTWFKNTFIGEYQDGQVVVCVPSIFYKDWLEKKFHQTLVKLIEQASGDQVRSLTYRVEVWTPEKAFVAKPEPNEKIANVNQNTSISASSTPLLPSPQPPPPPPPNEPLNYSGLNLRNTFSNFIVGRGNELAHAAAQAVANRPGLDYNPLYIYGGVGLGKTHLIQAAGNQVLNRDRTKKVLYVTSETFTNEYINAVRTGRGKDFKDYYRNVDVLIIDDIQFISGKEGTQEELFHTFNTLKQASKQIIISSDRPPKAIPLLEPRLLSRFEWGLIVDVAKPDLETRLAILETKCIEKNQQFSKDILQLIASLIQNNVRELEGALNKLIAYRDLKQIEPTPELIKDLLINLEPPATGQAKLTMKQIIETVTNYFDLKIEDLLSKKRDKHLSHPRQIIMFLLRDDLRISFPTIGKELGGRDHTTAIHAHDKIKKLMNENSRCFEEVAQIRQKLGVIK